MKAVLLWAGLLAVSTSLWASPSGPTVQFVRTSTGAIVSEILAGEEVAIQALHMPPRSEISLECRQHNWVSKAIFQTDDHGTADLSLQAPLEGTYSGVDPDGMFWSQIKDTAHRPQLAMEAITCSAFQGPQLLAQGQLARPFAKQGISWKLMKRSQVGFWGAYAEPLGEGPFPAVIIVGGSEGGMNAFMSEYFASQGYAALTLAYFSYEDLPKDLDRIPLEYFKTAITWLKAQPKVQSSKLGLIGFSRGGELALLLGSTFSDLKAVVAVSPSTLVWSGNDNPTTGRVNSTWTLNGKDIPFMPYGDPKIPKVTLEDGRVISDLTAAMREVLKNWKKYPESEIAIEKTAGPILMLGGDSDLLWPACDFMQMAQERLKKHPHAFKDSFHCYRDGGHLIGIPGEPTTDLVFEDTTYHMMNSFGGTAAGTALAQRRGWAEVLQFFKQNLH